MGQFAQEPLPAARRAAFVAARGQPYLLLFLLILPSLNALIH
jgi:hypothetical protein